MISLWLTKEKSVSVYIVYILKSLKSSKNYVGYTAKRINERLQEHNKGLNKWTKTYRPFKLVYYETYVCKTDAIRRERFFKSGQGKKLKKLILKEFG